MCILTRAEAKKEGLSQYFDGTECLRGHVSERLTVSGKCCECIAEDNLEIKEQKQYFVDKAIQVKEEAKDALRYIRETIDDLSEAERMLLITNYTTGDDDLDILPRSRNAAQQLGEKFYDTKLPCKNNHRSKSITETGQCVACIKQIKDEYKPYTRVYSQNRRTLVKEADGFFNKQDIDMMLISQGYLCVYCKSGLYEVGYHIDHVIPLARGGSNWPSNLQLLCPSCNWKKGAKLPEHFEKQIGFNRNE